jgi:hypothetical protein
MKLNLHPESVRDGFAGPDWCKNCSVLRSLWASSNGRVGWQETSPAQLCRCEIG